MRNHKTILGAGLIIGSMMLATPAFAQYSQQFASANAHPTYHAHYLSDLSGRVGPTGGRYYSLGKGFETKETYNEGVDALNAGQYRIALKSFKNVLSVARNHGPTNYMMGLAKADLGKFNQAKRYLRKSVKGEPEFAYAHMALGYVYAVSGDNIKASQQISWLESELGAHDRQSEIARDIVEARDRIREAMASKKS